jgi:hypothetical protein
MLNLAHLFKFWLTLSTVLIFEVSASDQAVFRFSGQVYFRSDIEKKTDALSALKCFKGKILLKEYLSIHDKLLPSGQYSNEQKTSFIIAYEKLIHHMINSSASGHSAFTFKKTKKCSKEDSRLMSSDKRAVLSAELYLRSLKDVPSMKAINTEFNKSYPHYLLKVEKTKELWL